MHFERNNQSKKTNHRMEKTPINNIYGKVNLQNV